MIHWLGSHLRTLGWKDGDDSSTTGDRVEGSFLEKQILRGLLNKTVKEARDGDIGL